MEYIQTLTEILKNEILEHYQNIKQFSDASGIPYMTISSVLKRGVENSVFGTVLKICEALGISLNYLLQKQSAETIIQKLSEWKDEYTDEELLEDLKESNFFLPTQKNFTEEKLKRIATMYRNLFTKDRDDIPF